MYDRFRCCVSHFTTYVLGAQVPSSREGIVEKGDAFFLPENMNLAIEAAQHLSRVDRAGQGHGGFTRGKLTKAENSIDVIFPVFVIASDLDGQDGAVSLMLADDLYGLFHGAPPL